MDPATFATELGILAVHGFENMGECARDLMVRNKLIAAQQSYALRRHFGQVCVSMYERTWRPVLSVWRVNLRVHGGHPWDMSQWVIDGIKWRWTY